MKLVVEIKYKDDDLIVSIIDDFKFYFKKRWVKYFFIVNLCSDEELDVENIEVIVEKFFIGKINEYDEDDDEVNDFLICFDIENDVRDRVVFE